MKIMKVVYQDYDTYESWTLGGTYTSYVQGNVHTIQHDDGGGVTIFVLPEDGSPVKLAMWIAPHAVQKLYYGEGE